MTWVLAFLLLSVLSAAGGVLYALKDSFKQMGASEEREKMTYRKIEGGKDAIKAKDDTNKRSNAAVRNELSKWFRK